MPPRTVPRDEQRAALLAAARRLLEESGPEALQARRLAAEIGASTQAIYTLFGGMPGLLEALAADGFASFAAHVAAVPETDDPVADHFAKGGAFCEWALRHHQLYRFMFGLAGAGPRVHSRVELTLSGRFSDFAEGQAAAEVLVASLRRVLESGRVRPVDPVVAAGQFLSATHGWVLLAVGGAFGLDDPGMRILGELGVSLMTGLGDDREAAERSLAAALERMAPLLPPSAAAAAPQ